MTKGRRPLLEVALKRIAMGGKGKLRWCGTQFPCQASAQDAEMSLTEYADFVFNAGLLHLRDPAAAWKKISTTQKRLADFLNKATEIRYFVPGGTDIQFRVTPSD